MVATEEKVGLKPYPFHDGQVNEVAAVRTVRLAMPLCPVDGNPELKQRDGTYKPNPAYTGEQNCQQVYQFDRNAGTWDVDMCESLGHDPYHFKLRRVVVEEETDEQGYVIDSKLRHVVEKRLNIMPISVSKRIGSGRMLALAVARGGKTLEEFGYASPCEFRSCSKPQTVSTRAGKYCSERHARLVALNERTRRNNMWIVNSDPYNMEADAEENADTLSRVPLNA